MASNPCLQRDYALPFAAWEVRLYLNSHPSDRCALQLYQQLLSGLPCLSYAHTRPDAPTRQQNGSALENLDGAASSLGGNLAEMLSGCPCREGDCCPIRWDWIADPWPWDGECPGCGE